MSWNMGCYVNQLRALSSVRTSKDERFVRHVSNVRGMKEISERETVSLEYSARKAQMAADRELRELDEDDDEDDDDSERSRKKKGKRRRRNEPRDDDVVLDEAFRILSDLIRLNGGAEVPEQRGWWF
jgi:hypothetical protein